MAAQAALIFSQPYLLQGKGYGTQQRTKQEIRDTNGNKKTKVKNSIRKNTKRI